MKAIKNLTNARVHQLLFLIAFPTYIILRNGNSFDLQYKFATVKDL